MYLGVQVSESLGRLIVQTFTTGNKVLINIGLSLYSLKRLSRKLSRIMLPEIKKLIDG